MTNEERLEQIRQVEEEIAWLNRNMPKSAPKIIVQSDAEVNERYRIAVAVTQIGQRILAREQSALAELRRGMKEAQ